MNHLYLFDSSRRDCWFKERSLKNGKSVYFQPNITSEQICSIIWNNMSSCAMKQRRRPKLLQYWERQGEVHGLISNRADKTKRAIVRLQYETLWLLYNGTNRETFLSREQLSKPINNKDTCHLFPLQTALQTCYIKIRCTKQCPHQWEPLSSSSVDTHSHAFINEHRFFSDSPSKAIWPLPSLPVFPLSGLYALLRHNQTNWLAFKIRSEMDDTACDSWVPPPIAQHRWQLSFSSGKWCEKEIKPGDVWPHVDNGWKLKTKPRV